MSDYDLLLSDTQETTTGRWATVTQASPLRIKVDGDSAQLGFTPDTLVAGLAVNDRVWVQIMNRRVVIVGKSGGGFTTSSIVNLIYPVGAIYMSVVNTSPATLFGGTWSALQDRFLVGAGNTYAVNATGGEATHVLTTAEMPSHNHPGYFAFADNGTANSRPYYNSTGQTVNGGWVSELTGGGGAHNNLPPYLAVYMWKRTA